MGFTLEDVLRSKPDIPLDRCVTDKTVYRTKREAQEAARYNNGRNMGKRQMRAFRCGYGVHYHLGHRR